MASEHAVLMLAGSSVPIDVVDVDGHEGMSQLFSATVRGRSSLDDGTPLEPKTLAGSDAKLVLHDSFQATRTLHAVVKRARTRLYDDGSVWLTVELVPAAWLLTLGRNCRSFQ